MATVLATGITSCIFMISEVNCLSATDVISRYINPLTETVCSLFRLLCCCSWEQKYVFICCVLQNKFLLLSLRPVEVIGYVLCVYILVGLCLGPACLL